MFVISIETDWGKQWIDNFRMYTCLVNEKWRAMKFATREEAEYYLTKLDQRRNWCIEEFVIEELV